MEEREGLKFALEGNGELFVITLGIPRMHKLCVDNLVLAEKVYLYVSALIRLHYTC